MQAIWIEIPVSDLARAQRFYGAVFAHDTAPVTEDDTRAIAVIDGTPTVSLNRTAGFTPSSEGSLPYFHLDGRLADAVGRAVSAGGTVVEDVTERPGLGVFALVLDSEGNGLYLHAAS